MIFSDNWDHAQQHMECTIYSEEEEELDRSANDRANSQECQGAEEHIYAHTVANRKYPCNLNHAGHIV
jgi:hypothetical protein